MKNYLFIIILISFLSCKENVLIAQEKNIPVKTDEIMEIGNLYLPEKMNVKQNKIRTDNKKENYQITLINSDVLDNDTENIKSHTEKIVTLYHKNLLRNIFPLNYDKITVKIEHKNGKTDIFNYTEKDLLDKGIEFTINTKFTIKVTPIDQSSFSYTILSVEPFDKTLNIWDTEDLFKDNGEKETIEFYFCEATDGNPANKKVILVMQSRSKFSIQFKSEIQPDEDSAFNEIANIRTHKGSKTTEIWTQKTHKIRLSKFELKK